jgi:hypothetical protein
MYGYRWSAPYWSPIVSGAIIGLGQVPLVIGTGKTLGASSCYVTIAANILPSSTCMVSISFPSCCASFWIQLFDLNICSKWSYIGYNDEIELVATSIIKCRNAIRCYQCNCWWCCMSSRKFHSKLVV